DATGAINSCIRPKGIYTLTERYVVYRLRSSDAIQAAQGVKDNHEVLTGLYCACRQYEVASDYTVARRAI
ncbi:hypothetical protein HAX54_001431, partial [Datura stramonium]|nr:hypothetical protein [Datura stramonium]